MIAGLPLDARLGLRMLVRYPALTLMAVSAMAFAIFIGAGLFEFINQTLPGRRLPLPDGERVVGLRYWDRAANQVAPAFPSDLQAWRAELRAVEQIGGFRTATPTLVVGDDEGRPVDAALMSPVGFRLAGVPPLLGRVLAEADTASEAPLVVVLGHRIWQARFGSDPGVVGRLVRIDDRQATVVGVMPEGFRFPVSHNLWMPLPRDAAGPTPVGGGAGRRQPTPAALDKMLLRSRSDDAYAVTVFARLAGGRSMAEAEAELATIVARAAAADPGRFAQVTAQVLPYRESLFSRPITLMLRLVVLQLNAFAALFLLLVSANIALLLFARAAARERELLLRTALGASRGRIVSQLFVEALVLAVVATGAGLAAVGPGLSWLERQMVAMGGGTPPFWFHAGVSAPTTIYAGALAVLAALVAGGLPALKATRQLSHARLGQVSAGGGGLRFGGIWTAVVVAQIAATVVATGGALLMVQQARRSASVDTAFPADQYLTMRVTPAEAAGPGGGFRQRLRDLETRLEAEPGVAGVTLAERLPLMAHPTRTVEVEGETANADADRGGHRVSESVVDLDFFAVLRAPIVAGRSFAAGDQRRDGKAVVVDGLFVERILGGRNAVGRRIRFLQATRSEASAPWLTIVGVVGRLESDRQGSLQLEEPPRPFVYRPLPPDATSGLQLAAHVPAGPAGLAPTVHRIAAEIGPGISVDDVQPLDRIATTEVAFWRLWADLMVAVTGVALVLSLAGIYAVMSFAVSRRTREIGIRVALGARPTRLVAEILRGPAAQVCAGVLTGSVLAAALAWSITTAARPADAVWLAALAVAVLVVCAAAAIVPARRALRVEPTAALNDTAA